MAGTQRGLWLVVVVVWVGACSSPSTGPLVDSSPNSSGQTPLSQPVTTNLSTPQTGDPATEPVDSRDTQPTGPLEPLPTCESPPEAVAFAPIAGLVLPRDAIVTGVEEIGAITSVEGYVPLTPSQFRRTYQNRAQDDDEVELLNVEDETYDAEVLIAAEGQRMYVQVFGICDLGSRFGAVVQPDEVP